MAYAPAVNVEQSSHLKIDALFFEEFRNRLGASKLPYDGHVKTFSLPLSIGRGVIDMSKKEDVVASYAVDEIADYRVISDAAPSDWGDAPETTREIINLASSAAGAYRALICQAMRRYGNDCGVSDWRDNNLRFMSHECDGPSISDPCGLVKAYLSFNLRFVACPREHVPAKKMTKEFLAALPSGFYQDDLQRLANSINEFFG